MCFLFDDKRTLSEPLDGTESMASQRAHTRGLIKIDTVRWASECRFDSKQSKELHQHVVLQVSMCSKKPLEFSKKIEGS